MPVRRVPSHYSISVIKISHGCAIRTTSNTCGEVQVGTVYCERGHIWRSCEWKILHRHATRRIPTIGRYTAVAMPAWPWITAVPLWYSSTHYLTPLHIPAFSLMLGILLIFNKLYRSLFGWEPITEWLTSFVFYSQIINADGAFFLVNANALVSRWQPYFSSQPIVSSDADSRNHPQTCWI